MDPAWTKEMQQIRECLIRMDGRLEQALKRGDDQEPRLRLLEQAQLRNGEKRVHDLETLAARAVTVAITLSAVVTTAWNALIWLLRRGDLR